MLSKYLKIKDGVKYLSWDDMTPVGYDEIYECPEVIDNPFDADIVEVPDEHTPEILIKKVILNESKKAERLAREAQEKIDRGNAENAEKALRQAIKTRLAGYKTSANSAANIAALKIVVANLIDDLEKALLRLL